MAQARKSIALSLVRYTATLIRNIAIPAVGAVEAGVICLGACRAGRTTHSRSLRGSVDAVKAMRTASITLWHGAAAFCLSRVASLASLADSSPGRMSGDNVNIESIIGRWAGGIHAGNGAGGSAEEVMWECVVV